MIKIININITKSIVIISLFTMLFSCSKKIEEIKQLYQENEDIPAAETKNFNLTYTLQGEKVVLLSAPLMLDFSNKKDFSYQFFPKKIKIELTDKTGKKTIVIADRAYIYKKTNLSELIGNVQILGADKSSLKTSHLFWDANNKHIFGEEKTILQQNDEKISGIGFDSSLDFKNVRLNKITGILKVKK